MNQNTTINPRTGLKIAKPCYYDRLHYQCDVNIHDYGQEES